MTDADTIRNADDLWNLARAVQETISPEGEPYLRTSNFTLADLRRMADELLAD